MDATPVAATETRHSHGTVHHNHEGGEIPHEHRPGKHPLAPYPVRNSGSGNGASAAFGFGAVFIVVAAIAMLWQSSNHSACTSVLVQAASPGPCQVANAVWTLGVIGVVTGVALVIGGAILRK